MAKPIRDTFLGRVGLLIRGIFLYNTVNWRRASDGLKPPRISGKERQQLRPVRNLELIKPREKPRAKVETDEEPADEFLPEEPEPPKPAPERLPASKPFKKAPLPVVASDSPQPPVPTEGNDAEAKIKVKKRRVRHRTDYDGFGSSREIGGFLGRFFKRKS